MGSARGRQTKEIRRARFTLPLPPSVNHQYVTVGKRRVLSKTSRRYRRSVERALRRLRFEGVISDELVDALGAGYVGLFIDFYFETPLRRDLDGGLKITMDAICDTLGVNDNRVVDIHLVKRIDPLSPRIEVELEVLPEWQFDEEYEVLLAGAESEGSDPEMIGPRSRSTRRE